MRAPAPPYANEGLHALWHVSEDASIQRFEPHLEVGGYWISRRVVEPIELDGLGDLVALHHDAEIELRVLPNLWPLWDEVVASTLEYSGMRLRHAQPPK